MRQPKIARTIVWHLCSSRSRMRCVLQPRTDGIELVVFHDDDVVIRDSFPALPDARSWADALRDRMIARGWQQSFG